jgi:hypothetical protein
MTAPADYDAAIVTAMKNIPAGDTLNLIINSLRAGRKLAEKKLK